MATAARVETAPPIALRSASLLLARLSIGAIVGLALLVVGEAAPGIFPLQVAIEARGGQLNIQTDGGTHVFEPNPPVAWTRVSLSTADPTLREFQIDGSDVTSRKDRDPDEIRAMQATPMYQVAAWLRDESSYSRWEQVRLIDMADAHVLAEGREALAGITLPAAFRLEASLRRPEATVQIDLSSDAPVFHGVLEINRDGRVMTWLDGQRGSHVVSRWFFPDQAAPIVAELLQLVGRTAAAGFAMLAAAWLAGVVLSRIAPVASPLRRVRDVRWPSLNPGAFLVAALSCAWLVAACWVAVRLYHQLPHIIDAASYYFEANTLRSGHFWLEPPPMVEVLKGYLQTVYEGRWFSQYPPGAPAVFALGDLLGLAWLVGPLAGLALIVATAFTARQFFGPAAALATLGLGVISPFILFQAGSFMSHPVAGAVLAGALAAFAYAERKRDTRWYLASGALLGWGFLTRELSTLLFALPLGVWLFAHRRLQGLASLISGGLPFAAAYLAFNALVTGDPFLLPRHAVDAADRWGFGTWGDVSNSLGAGLIYTDQNLTLLQFDLFGWPPLFALSLLALPFLLGRAGRYDLLAAGAALVYVAGYVGVPGAGIVLGPRYYYEALPWMLLLAARGLECLAATLGALGLPAVSARGGAALVAGLLSLNTVLFYVPHLIERRTDYFAMDHNRGVSIPFVENTLFGPRLSGFQGPTLVIVPDVVVYKTVSALNCPALDRQHVQDCPVLFVQTGLDHAPQVIDAFPGRAVQVAQLADGRTVLRLQPYSCEPGVARCPP